MCVRAGRSSPLAQPASAGGAAGLPSEPGLQGEPQDGPAGGVGVPSRWPYWGGGERLLLGVTLLCSGSKGPSLG